MRWLLKDHSISQRTMHKVIRNIFNYISKLPLTWAKPPKWLKLVTYKIQHNPVNNGGVILFPSTIDGRSRERVQIHDTHSSKEIIIGKITSLPMINYHLLRLLHVMWWIWWYAIWNRRFLNNPPPSPRRSR